MMKVDIRELPQSVDKLEGVDFIEVEDKKEKKLQGIFISHKLAGEFKRFLEEKKEKEVQEKLEILDRIAGSCRGMFVGKSIQSIKAEMEI
ncbi:hypothetical protein [Hydrogenimonas thermophila]|nr:hypothetical protein [Hydrogenimonas thermophila]